MIKIEAILTFFHIQDPDVILCRWMAEKSTDATANSEPTANEDLPGGSSRKLPFVTVLESPPAGSPFSVLKEHVASVKHALSEGCVVVVREADSPRHPYAFDEDSIQMLTHRNPDGAPVQWHCK